MNYFSPNFLIIFGIAVIVIILRSRSKKKGNQTLPEKHIAIIGRQLIAPLGLDTPFACLSDDERKFGDGFQDKQEPELPHHEQCQCEFHNVVQRDYDLFSNKPLSEPRRPSDLGPLARAEARFYKYMLIINHRETSTADQESYTDLADRVEIDPDFKETVRKHLRISRQL
jgi:hypothetical protein